MSIPLIEKDFSKESSSKNDLSSHKVTASSNFRSVKDNSSRHLSAKDIECAIKTAIDPLSSDLHKSQHCHRKKKKYGKAKIKTVLVSESDSSDSDSAVSWHTVPSNSSTSSSESEDKHVYKTVAVIHPKQNC
ncbi:11676_t:CDS:1 [Gigaspora margarita]|uniref:11676_t:CDS:1 n=1 Tax=Gigaspora margarita TaxID=4874 RepID=A0ABN7UE53_GIGMA|nr:11676_t:CDS:1 [Gigaspora margarita]